MAPETGTRFFVNLFAPGGVLLAAAWAVQREPLVRDAAAPYAVYFAIGALAAALLLCWYHDQSRLLAVTLVVALAVLTFVRWPADGGIATQAAILLVPLNVVLFAAIRESGVLTFRGFVKVGLVAAEAALVAWVAGDPGRAPESLLHWREQLRTSPPIPAAAHACFAVAALGLASLVVYRRTKVEQGLLWVLAAMFLAFAEASTPPALLLYSGAAGLILVLAVLEHGDDIAYRDELTGLMGRRAFNSMMEQLGRSYAIAMCDVDRFKRFNDTYGHDAGDQVLKMVATKLSQVGGGGRVFRYGGEEFLVVFRGRSAEEAAVYAESVRKAIAETGFVLRGADRPSRKPSKRPRADPKKDARPSVNITVSIGIAERSTRHSTPELVLDAADAALYQAKAAGRNCVRIADVAQSPAASSATA